MVKSIPAIVPNTAILQENNVQISIPFPMPIVAMPAIILWLIITLLRGYCREYIIFLSRL
ncbi:hypothetical protein WSI_01825 [Candidatus Liberibacter asiaticus str. gxpsy]|uniref:Uncharacterized protein n=2 Tax=Liberibacter asiaticus TaxID=34021 RepID=C6XH47_LIBAP|nr:hypothetical protein CLIBASIA_03592 [Candidatus Liberibacter asiaticus str. psy62]AGH16735.1 hypothetical protein WSI_01825 [Candidatus Liberibacter asiaticus str. gxpsy]BAP26256.1 hypothetical protein CGUJ_03592 [Candidatus Liberibacter asiaticus str. Ishi-1]